MALIPTAHGKSDDKWVDPADPRACEIKSVEVVDSVGEQTGPNGAEENLLTGRSGTTAAVRRSVGAVQYAVITSEISRWCYRTAPCRPFGTSGSS